MKIITKKETFRRDVTEFLQHSNWIEQEYSDVALEDAEKAWVYIMKQKRVTVKEILQVHKILAKRIAPTIAGKLRTCDVWIGGEKKRYIDEDTLTFQLNNIFSAMLAFPGKTEDEKAQFTKNCHVFFEGIHPFEDGNGRTGRILYNWHRLQLGLPINIIHEGEEQFAYYLWFKKTI